MTSSTDGKGQEASVYVLQVMVITPTTKPDQWLGYKFSKTPLPPPSNPPAVVYTSDELDDNGVFQQAFAFQAEGEWTTDPRFRSEYVSIRKLGRDEIFVAADGLLMLRPSEIIPMPGSFAADVFGCQHGRQYENAMDYLKQAALDTLVAALEEDYFNCFGCSGPDELVDLSWKALDKFDLITADQSEILALGTSVIRQIPPPEDPVR